MILSLHLYNYNSVGYLLFYFRKQIYLPFCFIILLGSFLKLYVASVHSSVLVYLLRGRVLINFFNVLNWLSSFFWICPMAFFWICPMTNAHWEIWYCEYYWKSFISLPFFPLPSITLLLLLFSRFLFFLLFLLVAVLVIVDVAGSW